MIHFSELARITKGKIISLVDDVSITTLLHDSRKATLPGGAVFFAIKGERHDGHDHLTDLYNAGFRNFIVEQLPPGFTTAAQCNILQVASAIDALQQLAIHHRSQFIYPVIGITGSNGKTIIKEWLFQILSRYAVIVKNPGSYNSQIGVPLSVWQMQPHHTLGIFEAGISQPGEMEKLARIILPTLGLITNIGPAHDQGFRNQEEKIREKLTLFRTADTVIYCKDHRAIDNVIQHEGINTVSWGESLEADIRVSKEDDHYRVKRQQQEYAFQLPFQDKASVENCLHVVALMLHLGYDAAQIQGGLNSLKAVPMRLELKEGINQCQVIDDTYNNDLGALEISLQFLTHQHQKKKKTVILSDILQSGLQDETLVQAITQLVQKNQVQRFIGVGPALKKFSHLFPMESRFFESTGEFLEHFDTALVQQEVILVKGARAFEFEKIVQKLQRKVHGTVMEIDLSAVVHNFNYFKSCVSPSTKIMVMVKAFAYGSGSNEIANLLQYHQADYLGVAYVDEGVDLRNHNITLPVMVMNPSEDSFDQLLRHNLEPEVYNFTILNALLKFLKGRQCKIHLKLDTGMHRLGFEASELDEVVRLVQANPNLTIASIFSHLAGADETQHDAFSITQATSFKQWADRISAVIGYKPLYHILNSPGILRLKQFQFDMVRLGIGLYGIDPTQEGFRELKPVATLKTIISQIKTVAKGETIGYGRRGVAVNEIKLGTLAIGYADGFNRAFSRGVGEVLVRGKRAPVVGNVCMDMTMVDLTGIEAQEGDEVIIFGKDLPIQEVASRINTIAYEILTNTSERVKRVFVAESI